MKPTPFHPRPSLRTILAFAALALLSPRSHAQAPSPTFHIYLAFGQSNMEGSGSVPAAEKTGVNPRFQVMAAVNCPSLGRTKGNWSTAVPPLCRCGTGMTPVDYFGRTLVDSLPNVKVGVIVVAVAGTSIRIFDKDQYQAYLADRNTADWLRNIANEYGGNPYQVLVDLGKKAQQEGVIKGILLHQGETDAGNSQWPNMVKTVYTNLMKDLGLDAAKTPLLAGDLVTPSGNVARLPSVLPNSYVIPSTGLGKLSDNLHFSPDGYKEFGKRYAATMLGLLRKDGTVGLAARPETGYSLGPVTAAADGKAAFAITLPKPGYVSVKAYSPGGRSVELAGRTFPAGTHELRFASRPMPAGVTFLAMQAGGFSMTRRLVHGI